jgi:hypothetical protein
MPRPSLDCVTGGSPPGLPGNSYRNEWESRRPISSIHRLLLEAIAFSKLLHFQAMPFSWLFHFQKRQGYGPVFF